MQKDLETLATFGILNRLFERAQSDERVKWMDLLFRISTSLFSVESVTLAVTSDGLNMSGTRHYSDLNTPVLATYSSESRAVIYLKLKQSHLQKYVPPTINNTPTPSDWSLLRECQRLIFHHQSQYHLDAKAEESPISITENILTQIVCDSKSSVSIMQILRGMEGLSGNIYRHIRNLVQLRRNHRLFWFQAKVSPRNMITYQGRAQVTSVLENDNQSIQWILEPIRPSSTDSTNTHLDGTPPIGSAEQFRLPLVIFNTHQAAEAALELLMDYMG